jgi:hypothetical protein
MLLSSVCVDFWYMSASRGAFVVGYGGERDSGVKWEKTSVRPSLSTLLDLLTRSLTQAWFVAQFKKYKSHQQQLLLNSHSAKCIYN